MRRQGKASGREQLPAGLEASSAAKLETFVTLLRRWNRRMNLVAHGDESRLVGRHVNDALSLGPFLLPGRIIDLGTGAGLPGIPLAVVCPDSNFVLLDRSERRTTFVAQAVIELSLGNVEVVTADIDEYQAEPLFDTVVTRAVAPLERILPAAWRFAVPGGRLLLQVGEDAANRDKWPFDGELARAGRKKVAVDTRDGRQRFIWVIDKPATEGGMW